MLVVLHRAVAQRQRTPAGRAMACVTRRARMVPLRFSERTAWDLSANALATVLDEARRAGRSLLDLTESNPTRCGLGPGAESIALLGHPRGAAYDPSAMGHPVAREAVAGYYRE